MIYGLMVFACETGLQSASMSISYPGRHGVDPLEGEIRWATSVNLDSRTVVMKPVFDTMQELDQAGMRFFLLPVRMSWQACFILSGLLWWFLLVPLQKRQMAQLEQALQSGILDPTYELLSRQWNIYGVLATLLPVLAMAFMVF